jgi:hypothetical protein
MTREDLRFEELNSTGTMHRHSSHPYWHPITRMHKDVKTPMGRIFEDRNRTERANKKSSKMMIERSNNFRY